MDRIKLWFSPGACSLAPHILLHEIGASFERVRTPVSEGANLTEAFTRINPKNRVPVLQLDGELITELPAIATAISWLAPEKHLMGRSALDSARVYEWMNWLSGTVHTQAFGCLWRPERFSDDQKMREAIRAKGRRTVIECMDVIESKMLAPFVVGNAFTGADAFLLVFYRWGNRIGLDMRTSYPRFTAFAQALASRPSVSVALGVEGIAIDGSR